jgi:hypothetical protein
VLLTLAAADAAGAAQDAGQAPSDAAAATGEHLTVYLMTMGPGQLVWERFGHNAIWIEDARAGTNRAYNYGIFEFDQVDFMPRLIRGEMLYRMEAYDAHATVDLYRDALNRSVWIQELNLTGEQKLALQEFLQWNALPGNAEYLYDYYRDNCSTRVRDALDRALNGQLAAALRPRETSATYRSESQRLISADLPAYTGLLLAMGHPADQHLSAWEESFVPMRLAAHLRDVSVLNEAGERVPLVLSERVLYESTAAPPPAEQPSWLWWYVGVGLAMGALLAIVGSRLGASRRARTIFGATATLWCLTAGILGTLILLLWALTGHVFTYWNENLLQFNPLALVLAGLIPLALFDRSWASRAAAVTATLAAALSGLGFLLQVVPGMDQPNGAIIALALPVHVALTRTLVRWHRLQGERMQLRRVAGRRR